MIIVGLTGGIGSGKSTVSDYLKRKGCLIIDADEISRAATAPGGPALEPILREFGAGVFSEDGTLDRKKMSEIVFSDTISRNKLEDIVVTIVINEFHAQIEHLKEEDYNRYKQLEWALHGCFDMIFEDEDNMLTREARFKKCEERIKAIK